MHTYRILTDTDELERVLLPVLQSNGSEIPARGCYVAAVEFDGEGNVVAYQMLQNAIFLEGMWARKGTNANLLRLHHMVMGHAKNLLGGAHPMTFTRDDETGNRIGRLAQALGFKKMNWNVWRKV